MKLLTVVKGPLLRLARCNWYRDAPSISSHDTVMLLVLSGSVSTPSGASTWDSVMPDTAAE